MTLSKQSKNKPAFIKGLMAAIAGDYPAAIELLTLAAEQDHHNEGAFLALGEVYRQGGQPWRAVNIHEPLALRSGLLPLDKTKIYLALAKDYEALKQGEKAIENYQKAISLDNQNIALQKKLFYLLKKMGRWEDAYIVWENIRRLRKDEPAYILAYIEVELALGAKESGELKTAEKKVKQALSLYPKCVPAILLKGDLLQMSGKEAAAYKEWVEIIELAPRLAFLAFSRLEKNLFKRDDYDKMLELYQEILLPYPESKETRLAVADFWIRRGNFTEAINQLTEAKNIKPYSNQVAGRLVKLMLDLGMYEPAKEELDNLIKNSDKTRKDYRCHNCHWMQKQFFFHCPSCGNFETVDGYF